MSRKSIISSDSTSDMVYNKNRHKKPGLFASMFSKFFQKDTVGIDLGTANILVYIKSMCVVVDQPSMVAVVTEHGIRNPYLYGQKAKAMLGKTPANIEVVKPMSEGVIADFNVCEQMIKHFIDKALESYNLIKPIIVICVPYSSTAVDKRAIQQAAERCGARNVFLVYESIAAAIGASLDINAPSGSMIVDIGGGTTEISVISLGGIVYGESIKVAGNELNSVIAQYIKQKYSLLVGESTAEAVKKEIGIAVFKNGDDNKSMKIRGRDLKEGVPKEIEIYQQDIIEAISGTVIKIVETIKLILEKMPEEMASDIVDKGIVLTGGGALLANLDFVIAKAVNLPVFVADEPLKCVINGIGYICENINAYSHILFKQS